MENYPGCCPVTSPNHNATFSPFGGLWRGQGGGDTVLSLAGGLGRGGAVSLYMFRLPLEDLRFSPETKNFPAFPQYYIMTVFGALKFHYTFSPLWLQA